MSRDADALMTHLRGFAPRIAHDYINLLKAISEPIVSVSLDWKSPIPDRRTTVTISAPEARRAISFAATERAASISQRDVVARIRAINLDTGFVSLQDISGTRHSGKLMPNLMESSAVLSVRLDATYRATIETTETFDILTDQMELAHRVIRLRQAPDSDQVVESDGDIEPA